MIKDYLLNEGYEIEVAYDGEEALEKFNQGKFNLILLDLMLPKIDGMTIMRKVRNQSVIPY